MVGQPFGAQLSAVLTTFTDTDVKHVRLQRALLEEGGSRGPEHRRVAREDVERIFSALFTEGERQGVLPAQEHQVLLAQLLGLLRATFDLASSGRRRYRWSGSARQSPRCSSTAR